MPNRRNLLFAATSLYTLLILYCMFFAFGRNDSAAESHTFIFIHGNFLKLPSLADLLPPTLMDLVSLGNIAAFIPFGMLIPSLYPMKFMRFLIGFGAYKLGMRAKSAWRSLAVMGVSVVVLLIGTSTVGAGIDQALAKNPGPFVALNEPYGSSGSAAQTSEPHSFVVGGQEIVPEFKLYDAEDGKKATYSYKLDNEEFYFRLAYGIPDSNEFKGSISVSVDGREIFSDSAQYQEKAPSSFEWYFEQAGEMTITVEGNEKAWDAGYREMKHWWE